jgi:hypothetical protein
MHWGKLVFLLAVLAISSGYRFRCWWMCTDQTSTQNDYVEQRDRCREYAQLKLDMVMRNKGLEQNEQNRKQQIIALFSDCMGHNGWTVSDLKPGEGGRPPLESAGSPAPGAGFMLMRQSQTSPRPAAAATAAPVVAPMGLSPEAAEAAARERAAISRSAECSFARYAASTSSIASARAKACDLECSERLKAIPDGPKPAACASEPLPELSKGVESVDDDN